MYVPIALAVGTLFGVAISKTIETFKNIKVKNKKP
jgi:hypothetical protein